MLDPQHHINVSSRSRGPAVSTRVLRSSLPPLLTTQAKEAVPSMQRLMLSVQPQSKAAPHLHNLLNNILRLNYEFTPSLGAVVSQVLAPQWPGGCPPVLAHDHFAFRTLGGVPGLGMAPLMAALQALGYRLGPGGDMDFPKKKLTARWLSPPPLPQGCTPLPRVFVSELRVPELSDRARGVLLRYAAQAVVVQAPAEVLALACMCAGSTPWTPPSLADYHAVAEESEYGAWVLAHGYKLNHTALALHGAQDAAARAADADADTAAAAGHVPLTCARAAWPIHALVDAMAGAGVPLNHDGGVVKVSPDGLLLQCATLADRGAFRFGCGGVERIPGAYVEFVERRPLPQYAHVPESELHEWQRRDGFEVGNADTIFTSTNLRSA